MNVNGANGGRLAASGRPALSPRAAAALQGLGPWLGQAGLPFMLVTYLGLRGGGYDDLVRSEVGIAIWWVVLLGAAFAVLPLARLSRASWIALGSLSAFAVWTALGIIWSESAEQSVAELGRVAMLLGVLALALSVQGRDGLRRAVAGVASAIVVVGGIALLSRLQPQWFPELDPRLGPEVQERLHYPLNYWNGLAAFVAMGVPLLLTLAAGARTIAFRALALGAVPALALAGFLTLARSGLIEVGLALAILFALHPRRLALLAPTALAGIGSAVLIAAASQRDALLDDLGSAAALSQGDEMLAMTVVVCAGVALCGVALALALRHEVGPRPALRLSPRVGAVAACIAVIAGLTLGAGEVADGWDSFKNPDLVSPEGASRFESFSGSGRYQYWDSALDATATDPLLGIGPGTFEFWWAREGSIARNVRSAHSLFFETLAEVGLIGLVLIVAVVATPFVAGARRLRRAGADDRALLAGALAACAVFVAAAAIDWVWELAVLPVAFLLLAAAIVRSGDGAERAQPRARIALVVVSVAALIGILIPMASDTALRDSQASVRSGDLTGALDEARDAGDIEPYAASPSLQQALVLELGGDLDRAITAARDATAAEPTNWRTWLVRSRIEAAGGNAEQAVAAYREARALNPRSPLFR